MPEKVSDQIERWLASEGEKTLGSLIDVFEEKSFALVFILLLGVPALPLPTGGATHVFEIISILVALQLVVGRDKIWLPERWRRVELGTGGSRARSPSTAPVSNQVRSVATCSSVSRRSSANSPYPGSGFQGGITRSRVATTISAARLLTSS